jgi:hypothetical protein
MIIKQILFLNAQKTKGFSFIFREQLEKLLGYAHDSTLGQGRISTWSSLKEQWSKI